MSSLSIADVRLTAANPRDRETGLLGFVRFTLDGALLVDGVTLRRTAAGELRLSYPARRAKDTGEEHPFLRPLDDRARREVEAQVFAAIGIPPEAWR